MCADIVTHSVLDVLVTGSGYSTRPRSVRSRGAPSSKAPTPEPEKPQRGSSASRKSRAAPDKGYGGARGPAKAAHAAAERGAEGSVVRSLPLSLEEEKTMCGHDHKWASSGNKYFGSLGTA